MKTDASFHRRPHFPGHRRLAALLLPLLLAAPLTALHAQAPTKIFVASYGSDANDGSRGAPKRNFQPAHDAVAAGGQIVVLDTAGYGALNITKSLAITVPPGVNGFTTVTGSNNGITINASGSDSVSLRGLIIEGGSAGGGSGIRINSAANVAVEDCTVRNFNVGIAVFGPGKLYLRRCTVRACNAFGLQTELLDTGSISVIASNCQFDQIHADAVEVNDFSNSGGGNGNLDVTLRKCTVSGNNTGIDTFGAGARVRVDNCRITGNAKQIDYDGSQVLTRLNNTVENNTTNNAFTGSYSAK